MPSGDVTHQQVNALRQREEVRRRVEEAMRALRIEVEADAQAVPKRKPVRLSLAVLLRRAGGIDKNTLRQPYHQDLRREVDTFLVEMLASFGPSANAVTERPQRPNLDYYAQMLVAAQFSRDAARVEAEELRARVVELESQNACLNAEIEGLRSGATNVLALRGNRDG